MLVYTVKRGDTLWQIAKEYQISLDALLAANPLISDPNYILPGSKINVPRLANVPMMEEMGMDLELELEMEREMMMEQDIVMEREMVMERAMATETFTMPNMVEEPVCTINGARPCIYITKGGETLHSISEEWGVPLAQLHYHNYQYAQNMQLPGGERIIMPLAPDYRINMENYAQPSRPRSRRRR